ncbi:MAG: hypothetical protein ACRDDZ_12200 [Marinifilaceae bacterium]
MKQILLVCIISTALFSSCGTSYYQVQKIKTVLDSVSTTTPISTSDFEIVYDFWSEYGDASFMLINKSNNYLLVNTEFSYYILNGVSYSLYPNFTYESTPDKEKLPISPQVKALTMLPNGKVMIPPHGIKRIGLYNISTECHANNKLTMEPSVGKSSSIDFSEQNSPIKFTNVLSISVIGPNTSTQQIIMPFYVSKITNLRVKKDNSGQLKNDNASLFIPYKPKKNNN